MKTVEIIEIMQVVDKGGNAIIVHGKDEEKHLKTVAIVANGKFLGKFLRLEEGFVAEKKLMSKEEYEVLSASLK
jgi:hypothetical protein